MAFKMKGFPYKSGFKHSGGNHEDHHTKETTTEKPTEELKTPTSNQAPFDVDKELNYINRSMKHDPENPYWVDRKKQIESYLSGEGSLKGYIRAQ